MAIPLRKHSDGKSSDNRHYGASPLYRLEHALHKPVAFLIVPVFGFANAGLSFAGMTPAAALAPVPLGVALGLFAGKQAGIFLTALAILRLRWAAMPRGATLMQLYGVAVLCGIGFTMSLFIGNLAFGDPALVDETKIGVLAGSIASALLGLAVLRSSKPCIPADVPPVQRAL
jgi:NhaA family Na+:H+ antiporter